MTPSTIELHIESLTLHGFPPGDRHRIAEAVKHELTRLFAEQGMPAPLAQGGEAAHLDGGAFDLAPGSKPKAIGAQVAQHIYGGFQS